MGAAAAGVYASNFRYQAQSSDKLDEILKGVKAIEADLGITSSAKVDPIGNFPTITDKHRSLTCKALKKNPELYYNNANKKTPMGFTFDQAIQAGLDAPHLGVGELVLNYLSLILIVFFYII